MDFEVIIAGGGPVGMLLAAELALADVKVCVLERLRENLPYSRALTVHPRTLEILDMRGLKTKLLQKGTPISRGHFAGLDTPLDFSVLDSSSNYTLFLPEIETEKQLEEHARSLGVEIRREEEVVSVRQDEYGTRVVSNGPSGVSELTAAYIVGADGAGSLVRKQAGIPLSGTDSAFTAMLGDVVLPEPPREPLTRFTAQGMVLIAPVTAQLHRVVLVDPQRMHVPKEEPVTLEELRSCLVRILGSDLGITDPFWMSRFGSSALQAEVYRKGRIFLAGDAAHIHFPAGGQGMNVGLQEAMNLGWKLAGELKGWAPNWLLDSYHGERFPVNTALLRNTEVQALMLFEFSPRIIELRDMLSKLLQVPEANYLFSSQISAFDVRYEPDGGMPLHPLNGRRFTELKLQLDDGAIRNAYELLRSGSFLFLQLTSDDRMDDVVGLWNYKHVQVVRAALVGMASDWDDVHTALIRPDGYIAWAVSRSEPDPAAEIRKGMIRWCGGRDDS